MGLELRRISEEYEISVESLEAYGIVVSARGGGIRLAPHGYTTVEEIDQAVRAIATQARR